MDIYGIGASFNAMVEVYRRATRATGRSTELINLVKAGDTVFFLTDNERRHFRNELHEKSIEGVVLLVCEHNMHPQDFKNIIGVGRVYFDHMWIEERYAKAISRVQTDLQSLDGFMNRKGPTPETNRSRREMSKWL